MTTGRKMMTRYEKLHLTTEFTLTLTRQDFAQLARRIQREGLGDWCVLESTSVSFPLQLMRINYDTARGYRKEFGKYLRENQWDDIDVVVYAR